MVMVSVPVASGSGKSGAPWERMQAVYLTPAAPVPTSVDMLPPNPPAPGGNNKVELLLAPLLEGVVARLATDGVFGPPPQPAERRARLAGPVASRAPRRARRRRFTRSGKQSRLKRL